MSYVEELTCGALDETEQEVLTVLDKCAMYRDPHGVVTHGRWLIVDSRRCSFYLKQALAEWRAIRADMIPDPSMSEDAEDVRELVMALARLLSHREQQEHSRSA